MSSSVLVGVTAFFRDALVWDALSALLREYVGTLDPLTQLRVWVPGCSTGERVWVPGCSTGEEAYTVAMLAAEALGLDDEHLSKRLKIFATDLNDGALTVARRARYTEDAVTAIPQPLRQRWLRPIDQEWEIAPVLRQCVVIAPHNVAFDPPFPRVHVISLRNTLIYFQSRLQDRVLRLCQFALVPDGLLILGKSEQVPRLDGLVPATLGHHIYRRSHTVASLALIAGRHPTPKPEFGPAVIASRGPNGPALYRRLLRVLAAPSLILDENDMLIEVIGDVSPWCVLGEGPHSGHVIDLLREPYRLMTRSALAHAHHGVLDTVVRRVTGAPGETVDIAVVRVLADGVGSVISFAVPPTSPVALDPGVLVDSMNPQMAEALQSAENASRATVEDLSNSNEQLQALNEELQTSAEELQATSEEAQASNEELETLNEELTSLNRALQAKAAELVSANADLENIQASMTSGLVMVDRELKVLRFSPLAVRVFSLIDADIGRPLAVVPATIAIPTLVDDLRATVETGATRLIELSDASRDLLLQLQPYRGASGEVVGALVVVIDVSDVAQAQREQQRALENLNTVADSVRELVWQRDDSGALTYLTRRVEDIYGLDRDRVLADPRLLTAAVHPADRDRVAAAMASAERRWQVEYRIVRPDGTIRWIDESAASADPVGTAARSITGSALDVTERHRLQMASSRRDAVLDALLGTHTVGVLVLDADDRILQASAPIAAIVGHTPNDLIGTPLNVLLEHDPAAPWLPSSAKLTELHARRILGADGAYRSVTTEALTIASVDAEDDGPAPSRVVIVHDVTRLREITADLASHQTFDQQTGLLTRAYFRSRTEELISAGAAGLAVLWIDLDGFKDINDRFGHRSGDVVLATIAARLQRATRHHDVLGRLGGDEFAILVTRVEDLDTIEVLAHRILNTVREPVDVDGVLAYVSASVGIAIHPQDGQTAEELLHNADTGMYAAKRRGRDRHAYFAEDMNNRADERAALRRELAGAIRRGELELHYQPVLNAGTRRLAHVEALLRWRRGDELVSADSFIPHAIETAQMPALGKLVLNLLDADMTDMHRRLGDEQPQVAVNLSAIELEDRDTTGWLLTWNPPGGFGRVIAEVTESAVLTPDGRAFDTLTLLRRLGATISIDDFGTGYSNLEALDRLEPEIIKIDRSLLHSATEADGRGIKILAASIQLAHALDAHVVAEGVADHQMWTQINELGAEMAQGFFLAPPMPLSALLNWITERPNHE